MAEILTVDNQTDAEIMESAGELSAEEQDSLKIGEQLVDQQEQLLAGKYKNAEELEKAYVELESKLGKKDEDTEVAEPEPEAETETPEVSPNATVITDASKEYWDNDGKLSPETLQKFTEMSSTDLVNAYIEAYGNEPPAQQADLSEAEVNQIQNSVGGEKEYQTLVNWASDNLDQRSIQSFDNIIDGGNMMAIQLALNGLKSQYDSANGYEGRMLSGKAPKTSQDVYRSQAELVNAMNDKRYDNDPAYRQDVIEKLDRSDIKF